MKYIRSKMKKFLLTALFLISTQASVRAGDPCEFNNVDRWMLGAYTALHVIDYRQTSNIDNKGGRELNPILGPYPTQGEINRFFFLTGMLVVGVACYFEEPYRKWFLGAQIGIKGATVYWNYRAGF